MFIAAIKAVAIGEPNTSYRNPISLEKILLDITIAFWKGAAEESDEILLEFNSRLPVEVIHAAPAEDNMEVPEGAVPKPRAAKAASNKKTTAARTTEAKTGGAGDTGTGAAVPAKTPKRKAKNTPKGTVG
jgi:hypothetical protein